MFNKVTIFLLCLIVHCVTYSMEKLDLHALTEDDLKACQRAADRGDTASCHILGSFYIKKYQQSGNADFLSDAEKWFLKAAQGGHLISQHNIALLYQKQSEQTADLKKKAELVQNATRWYRISAARGHLDSQNNLAVLFAEKSQKSVDSQEKEIYARKAEELYTKAAKKGNRTAQYNLGRFCTQAMQTATQYEKKAEFMQKAVEWLTKAAEQDETDAQIDLALLYAEKSRGAQDVSAAAALFVHAEDLLKKADLNSGSISRLLAAYNLFGIIYKEKGEKTKALDCFERALSLGNPDALYNAGVVCDELSEQETDQNRKKEWRNKAKDYYLRATHHGIPSAFVNLASYLQEESEQASDVKQKRVLKEKSFSHYLEAARLGSARAQYHVSTHYLEKYQAMTDLEKYATPADNERREEYKQKGGEYHIQAARQGYEPARANLAVLKTLLDGLKATSPLKEAILELLKEVETSSMRAKEGGNLVKNVEQQLAGALLQGISASKGPAETVSSDKDAQKKQCPVCKADAANKCSRCKMQWYCSRGCQGKHWQIHKLVCRETPKQE